MSRAERDTLFHKCASSMTPQSITNWFLRAPGHRVLRENVADWLLWALFSARSKEALKEWEEELDSYISVMGGYVGYPIGRGINFDMQCLRPTMDPIHMIHRPFIWYMVRIFLASKTPFHVPYHFWHRSFASSIPWSPSRFISKVSLIIIPVNGSMPFLLVPILHCSRALPRTL